MLKRLLLGILVIAVAAAGVLMYQGKDPVAVASKIIGNGIELAAKIVGNGKEATGVASKIEGNGSPTEVASKIIGNGSPATLTTAEDCVKGGGEWQTTNRCGVSLAVADR